ncbi:DUF3305 domain-containing protein [Bosea caraganae]|uniref:DUF3305 domain-containing protein n=1 Tax=Bosea caraganae TaxID=2763117 RepID=A0A370KXI2_9HYPH|nr:DUF3305 domain-containing protein [Bosea caraganae]RDJ19705.1 DUF3305 domain-containing protein [Bosea caraganae]RDJ24349.1 DUF3305 domain-containing protein [Bosea caraganae]
MAVRHLSVGIVAVKRKLNNPWVDFEWLPEAVLPGLPAVEPRSLIGAEGSVERWYLGEAELAFHSGETSHYRDNLVSGRPAVWVALRESHEGAWHVAGVTVDPYEGESFVDVITDKVEALPMPHEIAVELQAFIDAHHVEQPFHKRKRDRKDPDAEQPEYGIGHPLRQGTGRRP